MGIKLEGKTDIEKAIFLLREIDTWLSFNQRPEKEQLKQMRLDIQDFTKHFPNCWDCGDNGFTIDDNKCHCTES